MMYLTGDIYMSRLLEAYGEHSEREARLLADLIQSGDVIADLGAHIGAMSLAFAKGVGPGGMVIAFEP